MRLEQLTFTRFIAAFAILVYHFLRDEPFFKIKFIEKSILNANIGVSFFFVLSGFIMIIAYHKNNIKYWDYIKNRIARIYPVYLVALLFAVLMLYFMKRPIDGWAFLPHLVLLESWLPGYPMTLNFTGWSLSVEFFFYLLFPLLFHYLYKKCSINVVGFVVFIVWVASQSFFEYYFLSAPLVELKADQHWHHFLFYHPVMHLNQFLLGSFTALVYIRYFKNKTYNTDLYIIASLPVLVFLLEYNFHLSYHNGLIAPLFCVFIMLMSINSGRITTLFSHPYLVYLGELSYGIYILQMPIYWLTRDFILKNQYINITSEWQVFLVFLPILFLFCILSYRFIEIPMRNFIKSKF